MIDAISTTDIENSIVSILSNRYPNAEIYRRNATQTKDHTPTFVVNVDLQVQTEYENYQRKDVEIIVQYFVNDVITFNRSYNDIRDTLLSNLFVNSLPIIGSDQKVKKYLLIKDTDTKIIDDILSIRMISDYVDDTTNTRQTWDIIENLHTQVNPQKQGE